MQTWIIALSFAVLVATLPFSFVLRVLLQLPKPLAPAGRRWPLPVNVALVAAATTLVMVFIARTYGGRRPPEEIAGELLIAGLGYAFGLVLMLRQFTGVYPEFIVTTGRAGLSLRKTSYSNIGQVEVLSTNAREARLRIETARGDLITFSLPKGSVTTFYNQVRRNREERA